MKKLNKHCFPETTESPRTLKQKRINRHDQKYGPSFIEESKDKMITYCEDSKEEKPQRSSSQKERSNSNYIGSNEDLNSSMKKEIEQSNLSSSNVSSSSISPIKARERVEMSRRVDSHDSENRSIKQPGSIRANTQYRKSSNDPNDRVMLNEKLSKKKTLQQK